MTKRDKRGRRIHVDINLDADEGTPKQRREPRRDRRAKLYRDVHNAKIAGVCAGLAAYLGVSRTVVRAVAIVSLILFFVPTLIVYLIAAIAIDPMPDDLYETPEEAAFWRDVRVEPRGTVTDLRHKFRAIEQKLRGMEAYVTSAEYKLDRDIKNL